MTKYKSKPISFEGCNKIIAEHLKRGEEVYCRVWDKDDSPRIERWISSYNKDAHYQYDMNWIHAEPIPTIQRIMPPERAIPVLIAEGWRFDRAGHLRHCQEPDISRSIFYRFGTSITAAEIDMGCWPESIIEDVEE